jgi:hypothetical protein
MMRRRLWLVVGLFAAALLLVPATPRAGDGAGTWEIEGSWIDTSAGQDLWGLTMTIIRTGGNEYQVVSEYAGPPPGLFPGEVRRSVAVGPISKIGPAKWRNTSINYIQNADGVVLWTMVTTAEFELVEPNYFRVNEYWMAAYGPDKHARYILDGGAPDIGPYGPFTGSMTRVTQISLAPAGP